MSRKDRKRCWLKDHSDRPCDGKLRKCHLIAKQTIKREVGKSAMWDERTWVWACGGPMGNGGHHGMLDHSRTLRVPREQLPPAVEEFAAQHGIGWWLDREYGPLVVA